MSDAKMELGSVAVLVFIMALSISEAKYPCGQADLIRPLKAGEKEQELSFTESEKHKMIADFKSINLTKECGIPEYIDPQSPKMNGGDIKGDMQEYMNDAINSHYARAAIGSSRSRWPNKEVPYTLSSRYGDYSRNAILSAMEDFETKTCLKFVPRTTQRDYVSILPDDGCYSLVGRVGGRQDLSLDSRCLQKGIILHELMHSVGFFHEQGRWDRDEYVEILFENVERGAEDQFEKYSLRILMDQGIGYDYGSLMHYSSTAFSKNGRPTIRQKKSGPRIGQRAGFSDKDLQKLNKMYSCPESSGGGGAGETATKATTKKPVTTTRKSVVATCENDFSSFTCIINSWRPGFCSSNPSRFSCKKTCDLCKSSGGAAQEDCENEHEKCEKWAEDGYCKVGSRVCNRDGHGGRRRKSRSECLTVVQSYVNYMKEKCKPACGWC